MADSKENQEITEQTDPGGEREVNAIAAPDEFQEQPDQNVMGGVGDFRSDYPPVKPYSTPRQVWRAITPLLAFLIIPSIVGGIAGCVYGINMILSDNTVIHNIELFYKDLMIWFFKNVLTITMIGQLCCLAPFLPIWIKMNKEIPRYQRILEPFKLSANSFLGFVGLSLLLSMMLTIIDIQKLFSYEMIEEVILSGTVAIRLVTLVIVAPIVEELCFRGIILNRLLSWTKIWVAVVVQAALFGIAHMNPVQSFYGFFIGLALGFVYVRFRKLWLCILAHFAFNLPSVIISILQENAVDIPVYTILFPALVLSILCGQAIFNHPPALPVAEAYEPETEPQPV